MKYQVGDAFAGQTMETFHIVEVNEENNSYKFKVLDEDGKFVRYAEMIGEYFESDIDWQMLI